MNWLLLAAAIAAAPDAPPPSASGADSDRAKLEADIARELGAKPTSTSTSTSTPTPTPTPDANANPQTGGNPLARLLLLPDISAIGRANLSYLSPATSRLAPRDEPFGAPGRVRAGFEELELGLQAVVDPYARADAFLGFGSEGVDVEEAYLTWLNLPYGLLARGGTLFTPFGRVNTQHPHVWEFADRPLALQRLLGAESLRGPGIDVSWLAPVTWFSEVHLAYQSVPPALLGEGSRPGVFARAVQFFDVGTSSTVGLGLSGGYVDEEPGSRDLVGADVYAKLRTGRTLSYVALQAEGVARRLRGVTDAVGGWEWGAYAQAVWRAGRRNGYGVRVERASGAFEGAELRTSALTFLDLSEFQRLRFQAGWDRLPGGKNGFEAITSVEFSIGAHGAHPF